MKILHLIRHAKSDWGDTAHSDCERPINDQGRKSCSVMADAIIRSGCYFENVFCSSAMRSQETIEGIAAALPDIGITWQIEEKLYSFSHRVVFEWCKQLDDALDEVVLIGHNPAFTSLCNELGDRFIDNLATCGYAKISFPVDSWKALSCRGGTMETVLAPKQFNPYLS